MHQIPNCRAKMCASARGTLQRFGAYDGTAMFRARLPSEDADWPKRLRDQRNKPVLFRDFVDREAGVPTGLPIGFDDYNSPALRDAIRGTWIELIKLKEFRE